MCHAACILSTHRMNLHLNNTSTSLDVSVVEWNGVGQLTSMSYCGLNMFLLCLNLESIISEDVNWVSTRSSTVFTVVIIAVAYKVWYLA